MDTREEKKIISNHIGSIVGGIPTFSRYSDQNNVSNVHIMACKNVPDSNLTTYITVGTSNCSIGLQVKGISLRVELLFVGDSNQILIPNMLATCAFCIMNSGYKCSPGLVFYDVVNEYISDSTMKHILFVEPFLWEDKYKGLELEDKVIEWLLAVPISETESRYADKYGVESLEDLFEENNIDIFDLYRESVI